MEAKRTAVEALALPKVVNATVNAKVRQKSQLSVVPKATGK